MKTSSAKAKGRRLQQRVRDELRYVLEPYGIQPGDVVSTGMGQSGVDVVLSPAAKKLLDLAIECKNVEKLVVPTIFEKHYKVYEKDPSLKLLIHSKNHSEVLATLRWADLLKLLVRSIGNGSNQKE
jgi:hypothetical protein